MSENKNEIPGISPGGIKMELINFKNDILKDIRAFELSLNDKYLKADNIIKERIQQFEITIKTFNQKLIDLSNLIFIDNSIKEKVESLNEFKEEVRDIIFKRRAKFNDFETKIDDNLNRINNILMDSVIYPGLIGKTAKFKTFHEFMDYVVRELAQLTFFKEKSGLDLTPYKRKIEQTIDAFKIQMNNFCTKKNMDNSIKQIEEKINNLLNIYEDRLEQSRIENSQYAFGLKKKAEEMQKEMDIFQKNMGQKLEKIYNNDYNNNDIGNDIAYIKSRLNKINLVIKELLSYHPTTKKNFIHEFEKKGVQVYSGVKQYIIGNINANELSSMKKFTIEKSKQYDKSLQPPMTTPFSSPEAIKHNLQKKRNSYSVKNTHFLFTNNQKDYINDKSHNFDFDISEPLSKQFNEPENTINNNNENKIFKRYTFFRKKTIDVKGASSIETSKFRNKNIKNNENIIEEEKLINNISKFQNNNNNNNDNNSFSNISKDDNNKEKNSRNESSNSHNGVIIKEEDENIISDNSCKNLENYSKNNNHKNKKIKKNKNKEKLKISFNNEEDNNKDKINSINNFKDKNINNKLNKIRLEVLKEAINLNNLENNNIKILSLKKVINNSNNDNSKLILFEEKNKNISDDINNELKDNSKINNNDINSLKIVPQTPPSQFKSIEVKNNKEINLEKLNKKSIKNNSSFPKTSRNIINKSIFSFSNNNIQKSPHTLKSNILENNTNFVREQIPINYNFKPKNNIMLNQKINNTFTVFPKINKDLSINKINYTKSKDIDIVSKTLSSTKYSNKSVTKVAGYIKQPNKVLLTSPDNILPNSTIKKNIIKHSSSEKDKENKKGKKKNIYYNDYYLPYQFKSNEEIYKSMNILRINKGP